MPHERQVRAWLRRHAQSPEDIDELVQDCYCRFAMLDTVTHIENPRAYFFSIARNLLGRRIKRAKVVSIETVAELDSLHEEDVPSPEREAGGRLDYARMRNLIAALPANCREIVELRKVHGYSQREIAVRLGVTESVVENQVYRGVKALVRAWQTEEAAAEDRLRSFETRGQRQ